MIFDPRRIECRAPFEDPRQFPEGIDNVFVNGEAVVERGAQSDRMPGRAILARGS